MDLLRTVQVAEEAHQDILRHAPRLGSVIPDVLHAEPDFLHDLAAHRLLHRLPDLGKAGDQRVRRASLPVSRNEKAAAVQHADDHGGIQPRIDPVPAGRTVHGPLSAVAAHRGAAPAAEPAVFVPFDQMEGREQGENLALRLQLREKQIAHAVKAVSLRHPLRAGARDGVIRRAVDGEQIYRLSGAVYDFLRARHSDGTVLGVYPGTELPAGEKYEPVSGNGLRVRPVFVVKDLRRDILDHRFFLPAAGLCRPPESLYHSFGPPPTRSFVSFPRSRADRGSPGAGSRTGA